MHATSPLSTKTSKRTVSALALTALGIVFGDIGTSPLYTLKTVLSLSGGTPTPDIALGLLSLIVWTLFITTTLKYVMLVMRVDNNGEGGILALMSLLRRRKHHRPIITALGLFGAALIYGDGAITPAISVMSALEGLKIAAPAISHIVLLLSVLVLAILFAVQYNGTARIGWVFGPIMVLWFMVIGALGIYGITHYPSVLVALNPWYAIHYFLITGVNGFFVLGGVFLAVTGAEALYADMGHIGVRAIRIAWYGLVLPALVLNYAGQTALILSGASIEENIFYRLCPAPFLIPLIVLSTVATIIASQAIITGAFSMTRQAMQLGWCPRLHITQTSAKGYGQIYVGAINWMLMFVTIGLTVVFGSSDNLAAAYGIAVSLTMLLTTCLMFVAMREIWKWNLFFSLTAAGVFIVIDIAFFSANVLKILEGGWVPLLLACCIYVMMSVWRRGYIAVMKHLRLLTLPVDRFITQLLTSSIPRVEGTAVFITKMSEQTPPIILWHVRHNRALHKNVIAMSAVTEPIPYVDEARRLTVESLGANIWRLTAFYGFMESPDVPKLLKKAATMGCPIDYGDVTFYVAHETIRHYEGKTGLPVWQEELYAFMQKNSEHVSEYLNLPRDNVIEIGFQIGI
jgi:KUP system potassium uptake protein